MNAPLVTRQRGQLDALSSIEATRGLLVGLAGTAVAGAQSLDPSHWLPFPITKDLWDTATLVIGAVMAVAGVAIPRFPRIARLAIYVAVLAFIVVALPGVLGDPARALVIALSSAAVVIRVRWFRPLDATADPSLEAHPELPGAGMETASATAIAAWFLFTATQLARGPIAMAATSFAFGVAILYTSLWLLRAFPRTPPRERWIFGVFPALLLIAAVQSPSPDAAFSWLTVHQLVAVLLLGMRRQSGPSVWAGIAEHPARLLVTTFAVIALSGGIALSLPVCSEQASGISVIDAFFTSMSATCVTGLAVLDTPHAFTWFGQFVIVVLIQIGGLGIMTFSAAGVLLLGRRFGMRQEVAARDLLGEEGGEIDPYRAARRILVTTFAIEGAGAALLIGQFRWDGDPWGMAIWRGVFTAISAFCNAGFALQTDNMIAYQHQPGVLFVIGSLVILGGLGTPAVLAFPLWARGRKIPLQVRLVYVTTAILLVVPAIVIAAIEWNNALAGLSVFEKLNNAWFQSVVPRTAGFHSIDMTVLHPATITVTLILMFIGGSPFSTAGGVKTTTVALLTLALIAAVRGRSQVTAYGRTVSAESIYKAMAIMTMGTVFALAGFLALQLTQELRFDVALFEVISALGTVGLSLGATNHIDAVGKIVIMMCMFAGRVGPITLFLLLTERRREPKWVYPEEKVAVG